QSRLILEALLSRAFSRLNLLYPFLSSPQKVVVEKLPQLLRQATNIFVYTKYKIFQCEVRIMSREADGGSIYL
ncbi:MAG: hypothetical protein QW457_07350, partial [Candidatus Bathyarchaeia archaeon]